MSQALTVGVSATPRRTPSPWRLDGFRRVISPLVLVLAWEALSRAGVIPARTIAAPSAILATAWDLTRTGELPFNLIVSLARVAAGFIIGSALGVVLATAAGLSRRGEDVLDAPLQMLRTLPHLALVPLFILWFGIGELPKVALVTLGAVFPVYLNLFAGIRGIDPKLLEAGRVFGLDRLAIIRRIVLPGALPALLTGLRYGLGVSWLTLVVAEQINADSGIGHMINDARDFLRTDIIVVGLLVYALLGLGADALIRAIERRALRWRPTVLPNRLKGNQS
jgi:sulfonate transport system permease protein